MCVLINFVQYIFSLFQRLRRRVHSFPAGLKGQKASWPSAPVPETRVCSKDPARCDLKSDHTDEQRYRGGTLNSHFYCSTVLRIT